MAKPGYDTIIVGGGIAGLTSAAYLSRKGKKVLLLEKNKECGGLVNAFVRDGDWKLVRQKVRPKDKKTGLWEFASQEWELYDLSKDRTENNNLADKFPKKLEELKAKYQAWWADVEPIVLENAGAE